MEVTDSLIFLNTTRIHEWLMRGEQIRLGTNVSIAAGPTGVSIRGQQLGLSSNSSLIYSTSKGIFLGAAFEGSAIAVAPEEHVAFYGQQTPLQDLLEGKIPTPPKAQAFIDELNSILDEKQPIKRIAESGRQLIQTAFATGTQQKEENPSGRE